MYDSETPEEFEKEYNDYVSDVLSNVTDMNNYMCIRFYTDMYMSSFVTWITYLYGENEKSTTVALAWKYVKSMLNEHGKEIWKEVKPIVAVDAGGAVGGAMLGSCVGGVGAVPGAVTTGAATSAGECVRKLIDR